MGEKKQVESFVNSLGMQMIFVQAVKFDARVTSLSRRGRMNATGQGADSAFALNRPCIPVTVELDNGYYLSEFPVTNAMYRRFVKETGYEEPSGVALDFFFERRSGKTWDLEDFNSDGQPVTGVHNLDIEAFCRWISDREGRTYRVPTIYEFEWANRAGTQSRYWWGEYPDVRMMNYGLSQIGHPTAVGSYPPNPWGFYDMHGNVWEYCLDEDRYEAMGAAYNSPQFLTGIDAWGNFHQGPNLMRLLSTGFRISCDAREGVQRPSDLKSASIMPANAAGPAVPELEVTGGERFDMGSLDRNSANFLLTRAGTWILNNKRSTDRGKTWLPCVDIGEARIELRDGTILSVNGTETGLNHCRITDPFDGIGTIDVSVSDDDWQNVNTFKASVRIPLGKDFLPVRGLVELDDGRFLMTMYGHMVSDRIWEDSPVAFELDNQWIKTRVILVESTDCGKSWRYVATICYRPDLTSEGQNESDLICLPDGTLLAAMRTGIHGYRDPHGREQHDQPVLLCWSRDQGRTWSEPQRIYAGGKVVTGIYPRLVLTKDNVLALLRTRPDGSVVFSPFSNGSVWTAEYQHYEALIEKGVPYHAGMQDMVLQDDDTLLVIDVVSKAGFPPTEGWHAEGVPITVKKK